MVDTYKHSPFEGLVALRGRNVALDQGFDAACAYAERELGCVPQGRLREYVLLSVAAAMLQRVRDDDGAPLFIVKGGLICQALLGSNARPTHDLDGILACGLDEFVDLAQESLAQPWGCLSARIENARACQGLTVPHTLFRFRMVMSVDGADAAVIPCEGTLGEPSFMLERCAYPAAALDAVGLPVPDALWGTRLARAIWSKLLNIAEPYPPPGDARFAGYVRPVRRAKHLVDAVLLSRLCAEGPYCTHEELRDALEVHVAYENRLREMRGYPPFSRPLRPLPYDEWPVEYYIAAIQAGLYLSYEDALSEIGSLFERLDP